MAPPALDHRTSAPAWVAANVQVTSSGCWEWTGGRCHRYGRVRLGGRTYYAHRAVYEAVVGAIGDGMTLDHLCYHWDRRCVGGRWCRHTLCVRPDHLEQVTRAENRRRQANRG